MGSTRNTPRLLPVLIAALAFAQACVAPPASRHGAGSALASALGKGDVRTMGFPSGKAAGRDARSELGTLAALVVAGGLDADTAVDRDALAELRAFVDRGGRVLLLGSALRLVHDIGIEERAPSLAQDFRWGFDARTRAGRARLGFRSSSSKTDALTEGMHAASATDHDYFLVGGAPLWSPMCAFGDAPPKNADALARLVVECDGERRNENGDSGDTDAVVLARWRSGKGSVLGLGLEPDLASPDQSLRDNARAFVLRATDWLLLGSDGPLGCWSLPTTPTIARGKDTSAVPAAPALAHWGLVAHVHEGDGHSRTPDQTLADDLLPAFKSGASLVSLDLVDPSAGLPLPWAETDPLARPKAYLGSAFARGYEGGGLAQLCVEAHARGMLVHALLESAPFGDLRRVQLASLRYVARQWTDARRLADGAVDGVVLRPSLLCDDGLALRVMQDFQPSLRIAALGGTWRRTLGAAATLDADSGRPRGLRAAGISDGFRDGFPAARVAVGCLDADPTKGSYPDWIAEQAVAFTRDRRGQGGAMLWQGIRGGAAHERARSAAMGVSMEPLTAAVAARCSATGHDGYRAAQAALFSDVHPDFAQTVPAAAATVLLRNNHFRLLGTGGRLELDRDGLARFSQRNQKDVAVIADSFFRTRFFGGRPDANELRSVQRDFLRGEGRGEGGYVARADVPDGGAWPRQLAHGEAPRWPQKLRLALPQEAGRFSLRIEADAAHGSGVLAIGIDGEPMTFLPFAEGSVSIRADVPLHAVTTALRMLELEVVDGGAIALSLLRLSRAGDVAADADVLIAAGSLATLRERSSSTYHHEHVEVTTVADFPGFIVRTECERAVRGLQQERRFALRHHRTLRWSMAEGEDEGLREPFVLAADDPTIPDLAVVPLRLSRYERFALDGGDLVFRQQPEANAKAVFGFVFVDRERARDDLLHWQRALAAIERPASLELGERGIADLRSDLPFEWTRVLAMRSANTPFLVREGGWWTLRGAQHDAGADWLRVLHIPGDTASVLGGRALLSSTRPGPGGAGLVALQDPKPDRVVVRVLQASPLAAASVTMGASFDAVTIDGKPWAFWNGRTVTLPGDVDLMTVAVREVGRVTPRVSATAARLSWCTYDEGRGELVFAAMPEPERPATMPFTAILFGPVPTSVEGGELVDEKELRHQDAEAAAAARAGGTTIRFLPGIVRVRYGSHGS